MIRPAGGVPHHRTSANNHRLKGDIPRTAHGIMCGMRMRLPVLPRTIDHGYVYVVQLGNIYKVGFTRNALPRRVKACFGELVLTIPVGQHPARLERAIHRRFAGKRAQGPGFKREWFKLDDSDLDWIRGLSSLPTTTSCGISSTIQPE